MLNCLYFSTKLIQSYNGVLIYVFIILAIALNFLVLAAKAKEQFKIIDNKKSTYSLLLVRPLLQYIYIKSIVFIPVEIAPIVRRLAQLTAGIIIDKKILNKKELIGISIIIIVFIYNLVK